MMMYVCISSYLILSRLILSYLISSHLILSYLISSHLISPYLILSHLISTYILLSFLISYLILSYLILSYHLISIYETSPFMSYLSLQASKSKCEFSFSPYQPSCISFDVWCEENLLELQYILSLVIVSFIIITCMFDQVVIMWGEIRCLSLLVLSGMSRCVKSLWTW